MELSIFLILFVSVIEPSRRWSESKSFRYRQSSSTRLHRTFWDTLYVVFTTNNFLRNWTRFHKNFCVRKTYRFRLVPNQIYQRNKVESVCIYVYVCVFDEGRENFSHTTMSWPTVCFVNLTREWLRVQLSRNLIQSFRTSSVLLSISATY